MKHWITILGFLAFLSGCASKKISLQESFLKPPLNGSKLYFYTLRPNETGSTQLYLSAMILAHSEKKTTSILSFANSYDALRNMTRSSASFVDSIQNLDRNSFPISFIANDFNSTYDTYFHTISRKRIEYSFNQSDSEISGYDIRFSKQSSFFTIPIHSQLGIYKIAPLEAVIESHNESTIQQESILQLHVIDSIHYLLNQSKNQSLYWLDFNVQKMDGTLFFSINEEDKFELILNTFSTNELMELQLINSGIQLQTTNKSFKGTIELKIGAKTYHIQPRSKEHTSTISQFWMGAIEIIDLDSMNRTGGGNMFVL